MFKYHKLAIQNLKPQNAKTLLFTIVGFIIVMALAYVAILPVQPALYKFAMAQAIQQPVGSAIMMLILAILVPIIVYLFVVYPLASGVIFTIDKAISQDKIKFSNIFSTFTKGKYLKSVVMALITLVFFIVLMILNLFIGKLLNFLILKGFGAIQNSISSSSHALGISLTIQIVAATLVVFILSLIYWLFVIMIVNYTLSFTKDPKAGVLQSVKQGFSKIKNGHKTWFKLYLGILLLNLIVILLANPVSQLVNIFTGNMSQNVATVIVYALSIIVVIVRLVIYYINLLAIIQYHHVNGERIASSKKDNAKNKQANAFSATANNVKDKANNTQSKVKEQSNQAQSNVTDQAQDKFNDASDNVSNKASDKASDLKENFNNKD
ncbi:MAG TPA: hypothetical protein K8V85_05565 [Staphylococcus kloosii]|uniref:Lytic transglycosylase n=1 Tax=Staphylococcus kloosii TaxID=29384 RepID=A0A151A1K8_9STAP|nr:hypothetical protein [Staphylococcus kloosii]KYH13040.1 hypothetical protein A0131_11970 [Staphylococcus kloosii]HJF67761.1 hypothetical protein [Staphylococcus kloosii]